MVQHKRLPSNIDQRSTETNSGGGIMQDLLDEAAAEGKAVRIHVERNNPAMHLYQRLGFQQIGDTDVYLLMEWNAPDTAGPRTDDP